MTDRRATIEKARIAKGLPKPAFVVESAEGLAGDPGAWDAFVELIDDVRRARETDSSGHAGTAEPAGPSPAV